MKNNISIIISVVSLIAVIAVWFLKPVNKNNKEVQKIAYINIQEIISEYNYIKQAEKGIKLMSDDLMPKRDSIMQTINAPATARLYRVVLNKTEGCNARLQRGKEKK